MESLKMKPPLDEPQRMQPPKHLSKAAAAFFRQVIEDYELRTHHEHLLVLACEALDRSESARKEIESYGAFYTDSTGARKAHPAIAIERAARLSFAHLVRELGLDTEPNPQRLPPRVVHRDLK